MKILLTGGNGFLGRVIKHRLTSNHSITTLGRAVESDIVADLQNLPRLERFDLVIHVAGKAHAIPRTQTEKEVFFQINVDGTRNLVNALDQPPSYFIFISSIAVYGRSHGISITEASRLDATDPYGSSKIEAEVFLTEWAEQNNVTLTILRLPLVVEANPPGNLGAMISGIQRGFYFRIGKGEARKSMVLAEDVAEFIPEVAMIGGTYHLTDGIHPSFREMEDEIARQLNKRIKSLPFILLKIVAKVGNYIPGFPLNSNRLEKMTSSLTFDDQKARKIGWNPKPVIGNFIVSK